ncbi:hypothetical protein [Vibrio tritonius]|nr:hypothetical protein [Vibrio tritonius]
MYAGIMLYQCIVFVVAIGGRYLKPIGRLAMTVMNNQCMNYADSFSIDEIGAATNAFLKYESVKQVQLLVVMSSEEAIAILSNCTIRHVKQLLSDLSREGHDQLSEHYSYQLGLASSTVAQAKHSLQHAVCEYAKQKAGWIVSFALLGIASGFIL